MAVDVMYGVSVNLRHCGLTPSRFEKQTQHTGDCTHSARHADDSLVPAAKGFHRAQQGPRVLK